MRQGSDIIVFILSCSLKITKTKKTEQVSYVMKTYPDIQMF